MIQIVTGKLGAGKTLYTVILLYDALCKGRTVATNIQVNWDELAKLALAEKRLILEPDQLIKLNPDQDRNWHLTIPFGLPHAPLEVFLDEIHLFFNARDWKKTSEENKGLLSFLTQSRKAGVNVTFIAQEITTIEKQFRVLAEWELYIQSSDHLKFGPLGQSPIKFFQVIKRDPVQGQVISRDARLYNKRHFKLYGSYTFLDHEMNDLANNAHKVQPKKLKRITYRRHLLNSISIPSFKYIKALFKLPKRIIS